MAYSPFVPLTLIDISPSSTSHLPFLPLTLSPPSLRIEKNDEMVRNLLASASNARSLLILLPAVSKSDAMITNLLGGESNPALPRKAPQTKERKYYDRRVY